VACGQRIRRLARMRVKSVLSRAVLSNQDDSSSRIPSPD
jgi:hypothetical protein